MAKTNSQSAGSSPQPSIRRILTVIACIVIVIVVAMFVSSIRTAWKKMLRLDCQCNLRQISLLLREYAAAHDGHFPSTWGELNLTGEYTNWAKTLRCPSTKHEIGVWPQVDLWADYRLLPGRSTNDPSNIILAIEPLGNHGSAGANVLFVDGSAQWWTAACILRTAVEATTTNLTK